MTKEQLAGESPKQAELKSVVSSAWLEGGKRCGSATQPSHTEEGLCDKKMSMSQCCRKEEQQAMRQLKRSR